MLREYDVEEALAAIAKRVRYTEAIEDYCERKFQERQMAEMRAREVLRELTTEIEQRAWLNSWLNDFGWSVRRDRKRWGH